MRYVISYDLNTPGQNYQGLYDALGTINAERVLESQWIANRVNTDAVRLRDYIWRHMDRNDRLLVTCLDDASFAWYNLMFDPANS